MSKAMPTFPRYMRMDRKQYDGLLKPIVEDKKSPFFKMPGTGVYLIAASLGLKNKVRKKINKPIDVRLFEQLSKEERWVLFTIAIADAGGTNILLDGEKAIHIAEEYANGGIQILHDKLLKGSLDYKLENEIIKVIG